jgi:hypothetical protein
MTDILEAAPSVTEQHVIGNVVGDIEIQPTVLVEVVPEPTQTPALGILFLGPQRRRGTIRQAADGRARSVLQDRKRD